MSRSSICISTYAKPTEEVKSSVERAQSDGAKTQAKDWVGSYCYAVDGTRVETFFEAQAICTPRSDYTRYIKAYDELNKDRLDLIKQREKNAIDAYKHLKNIGLLQF